MTKEERALFDQKNDWLEEERRRESRISVWDIDDSASVIKKKHHDDCDSRHIKEKHAFIHRMADLNGDSVDTTVPREIRRTNPANVLAKVIIIFSIIIFIIIFMETMFAFLFARF